MKLFWMQKNLFIHENIWNQLYVWAKILWMMQVIYISFNYRDPILVGTSFMNKLLWENTMVPSNFNDALIEYILMEIKESFRMKRMMLQRYYKDIFSWRNIFLFNVWAYWGRHLLFHLYLIVCIAQQLKELSRHIQYDRSETYFIVDVSIRIIVRV